MSWYRVRRCHVPLALVGVVVGRIVSLFVVVDLWLWIFFLDFYLLGFGIWNLRSSASNDNGDVA